MSLEARLAAVRERIAAAAHAAGRDPGSVRILAVTKGQPVTAVHAALAAGLSDIGESRVQEVVAKRDEVGPAAATWHMIGHLQRNKARTAAALFDVVHSIDSAAIATALARSRPAGVAPLRLLIEVDTTDIAARTGVAPEAAGALLGELLLVPGLEVVGLMTIAPPGPAGAAERCFAAVAALRDSLAAGRAVPLAELSMGMSDDYELAVAHGATMVRLGRVLFGDRAATGTAPVPRLS